MSRSAGEPATGMDTPDRATRTLDALADADPRLSREYTRVLSGGDGEAVVVLVGVVHDHPASEHRVRAVVNALDPGALALEVPDLLVPLFEKYAGDGGASGEMAVAIDAARTDSVVGIDAPDRRSLCALGAELVEERPAPSTVARTLRTTGSLVAHTVLGRLRLAGLSSAPAIEAPQETHSYEADASDDPDTQAADEDSHLRRSTTFLRAFEMPAATRILDAVRERAMADRIDAMRQTEAVIAVVGYSHLDALADALAEK